MIKKLIKKNWLKKIVNKLIQNKNNHKIEKQKIFIWKRVEKVNVDRRACFNYICVIPISQIVQIVRRVQFQYGNVGAIEELFLLVRTSQTTQFGSFWHTEIVACMIFPL